MKKYSNGLGILSQVMTLPFVIIAFVMLANTTAGYSDTNDAINKETVEDIVEKYAIQCYASEGSYPPNLDYLVDHYGLILDEERYIYEYDIFASNVIPEIIIHDNINQSSAP